MYYDCQIKVRGGSIYYGIIFWPRSHPLLSHPHIKKSNAFFLIIKWTISHYLQRSFMIACSNPGWVNILWYNIFNPPPLSHPTKIERIFFTLFLAMSYECQIRIRGGSIFDDIIFWPPSPPPSSAHPISNKSCQRTMQLTGKGWSDKKAIFKY